MQCRKITIKMLQLDNIKKNKKQIKTFDSWRHLDRQRGPLKGLPGTWCEKRVVRSEREAGVPNKHAGISGTWLDEKRMSFHSWLGTTRLQSSMHCRYFFIFIFLHPERLSICISVAEDTGAMPLGVRVVKKQSTILEWLACW